MALEFFTFEFFVLTILFTLVLVQIALGFIFLRIYRYLEGDSLGSLRLPSKEFIPAYREPKISKIHSNEEELKSPLDIDLFKNRSNITESMTALCEKYSLEGFTIASHDGLVIASSLNAPEENAAQFSYLFLNGIKPQNRMIKLFGLGYNNQELVGIVRLKVEIPADWMDAIKAEAGDILTWWL